VISVSVSGWLAASGAGLAAGAVWRALGSRMESVARACHELRGPLTAARLGLQLGATTGELSPARLRAIDLELGRAALALDDLDTARRRRITAWRAPEPVDPAQLVLDSVEAWRASAAANGLELRTSWSGPSPTVWGDRLRLAQAMGNLIANAIEHGGAGAGPIEVRGRGRPGRVRIDVIDSGPGLPAPLGELARRPHNGRGERGRGLAIATGVVAGHGGRLAVAPTARGARLVIELPASGGVVGAGGWGAGGSGGGGSGGGVVGAGGSGAGGSGGGGSGRVGGDDPA
jgi:signal transduction histidine kinase